VYPLGRGRNQRPRLQILVTHQPRSAVSRPVAVVTGGAEGIGRDVVRRLAASGYAVAVGYVRDRGAAAAIVEEVIRSGGIALTIRADVADELDVERMFDEIALAFGGIDVLVHAAASTAIEQLARNELDRFDIVQRNRVRGTYVVDRQAARRLRAGGAIVNVSGSGVHRAPFDIADAATKAAVEAMTREFARDLRRTDITVNAVTTEHDSPAAIAALVDVVALLIGSDGRSLNGQIVRIDIDPG
jgi:3-oxoacyl-[acyl-carrier protein] reductase